MRGCLLGQCVADAAGFLVEGGSADVCRRYVEVELRPHRRLIGRRPPLSVLWSLYAFACTPDDYWTTICTAIAVGGDVDTTAAMAGAISGARLGVGAIPEQAVQRVHDQGGWRAAQLIALADTIPFAGG